MKYTKLFPPHLMYLSKCIYIQPLLKNHTYDTTVHLASVNSLFKPDDLFHVSTQRASSFLSG